MKIKSDYPELSTLANNKRFSTYQHIGVRVLQLHVVFAKGRKNCEEVPVNFEQNLNFQGVNHFFLLNTVSSLVFG